MGGPALFVQAKQHTGADVKGCSKEDAQVRAHGTVTADGRPAKHNGTYDDDEKCDLQAALQQGHGQHQFHVHGQHQGSLNQWAIE